MFLTRETRRARTSIRQQGRPRQSNHIRSHYKLFIALKALYILQRLPRGTFTVCMLAQSSELHQHLNVPSKDILDILVTW
jgi:hypothetical protein